MRELQRMYHGCGNIEENILDIFEDEEILPNEAEKAQLNSLLEEIKKIKKGVKARMIKKLERS